MNISLSVLCVGTVFVAYGSNFIFHLIKSKTHFVAPEVWAIMAFAFFIERYGAMHLQLYSLTNHIVWHIANGVTGSFLIIMAFPMYKYLGIVGLPASMAIAYLMFYASYSLYLSKREYGFSFWEFERRSSLFPFGVQVVSLIARAYRG